ncbi:hypothetical protein GCM10023222_06270 [Saccharopolyspora cebuensis]|uniref:Sensor domain-containing protein n=1 Tax=Saccharopolyspora cebuensis TaxID=418759 RepID=A0ABV4CMS5_9PSEU
MPQSPPPDGERTPARPFPRPPAPPDWGPPQPHPWPYSPPPPPQPEPRRPRRRLWVVIAAVQFAVIAALVAWIAWPAVMRAIPGAVRAEVLTPAEAGDAVGVPLHAGASRSEPPPPPRADPPECAVAAGPTTRAVYAPGWTRFHSATYQDSAESTVVTQVIGTYPDRARATEVFGALSDGVSGCDAARRIGETTSSWSYGVYTTSPDVLIWIGFQDGAPWACFRQARLEGSSVLQVSVCQAGDGAPATARLAERFFGRAGA